jgi:hypothetical protein
MRSNEEAAVDLTCCALSLNSEAGNFRGAGKGRWAAFIVVSRLGVRTASRGVLLLPCLLKKGLALDRLGWVGLAAISVGCGAPMVLLPIFDSCVAKPAAVHGAPHFAAK